MPNLGPNLKLGKLSFSQVKLAEINLAPTSGAVGTQVDGILGDDILEKFTFKLSYSKDLLLVGSLDTLGPLGTAIPLRRNTGAVFDSRHPDFHTRRVRSRHRHEFDERVLENLGGSHSNVETL